MYINIILFKDKNIILKYGSGLGDQSFSEATGFLYQI